MKIFFPFLDYRVKKRSCFTGRRIQIDKKKNLTKGSKSKKMAIRKQ